MPTPVSPPGRFSGPQKLIIAALAVLNLAVLCSLVAVWRLTVPPARPAALQSTPSPTPRFPPTWTPTPPATLVPPTATPTLVVTGSPPSKPPTPTPAPVSLRRPPPPPAVVDLARIMQGESPGDVRAAYHVGWVAKNRLLAGGYGRTYAEVARGFNGYRVSGQPSERFLYLARQVIRAERDPTHGSLYALSHADLNNLGLSNETAAASVGLWHFFTKWPRPRRF